LRIPLDGRKAIIVASPFKVLLNAEYSITVGDRMSILAFPSLQYQGTFVAAELKNLTSGANLVLANADGFPIGGRGGRGRCSGCLCTGPAGF
jgi:hypothetical protein